MEARPLNLSDPLLLDWGLATVNTGGVDGVGGSDISPAWLSSDRKHYLFATGGADMSSTPSVFMWNTTTFRSYGAMGPLHTYKWDRCAAYGQNPHFCGYGSYGRDPNFYPVHGSDHDHSDGIRVLETLQKTGEASGRDFYVRFKFQRYRACLSFWLSYRKEPQPVKACRVLSLVGAWHVALNDFYVQNFGQKARHWDCCLRLWKFSRL